MSALRRLLLILPLSLLIIFVQSTLLRAILPSFLVPNLLICTVVFLAFYCPSAFGAVLAFSIGLLVDLYGGVMLGPWAGAYVIVFLLFALFSQRIFVESKLVSSLVVAAATVMANLVFAILIAQLRSVSLHSVLPALAEALLSGVAAGPVLNLLRRVCVKRERGMSMRRSSLV